MISAPPERGVSLRERLPWRWRVGGRCSPALLLLVLTTLLLALFGFLGPARAEPSQSQSPKSATPTKTKSYTFTGLDIDGKLKTPQLLYFLNRMKSEFDTTTPEKRSFLPELKRSASEM